MREKLWTKDFTIITLGSFVSMIGNALASFAMSLFVLDYTGKTFYYAVYLFLYTFPQIVAPVIAGPLMDRFSRRRTIFFLDFATAAIYTLLGLAVLFDFMSFPLFGFAVFVSGTIYSSYVVAYESFFPLLITKGNYAKGYSIASVLETLSQVMVVVSTLIYKSVGLFPIMAMNAGCFLVAALFEMNISDVEKERGIIGNTNAGTYSVKKYIGDFKEGTKYLLSEKGLLYITLYFIIIFFVNGGVQVLTLPWFRSHFADGEFVYMSVWGFMVLGRAIGGMIHYAVKLPVNKKFAIALFVYLTIDVIEGVYLFLPLVLMRILTFLDGILGVTSYNIRLSATQSYVPNEKKGRFNGVFLTLTTIGTLSGQLVAGSLSEILETRMLILLIMSVGILFGILIFARNRKVIAPIYNRQA